MDWHWTLRIVLRPEKKEYVLSTPISDSSGDVTSQEENDKYDKHFENEHSVQCIMIACMSPKLQKRFMDSGTDVFSVMNQLKKIFQEQTRIDWYKVIKSPMG